MQESQIAALIEPILSAHGLELDRLDVTPIGKRSVLRVTVDGDGPDGKGPLLDDIAQAVRYCSQLIENPHRTVLVLISDFCEGGSPGELVRCVRKLAEAGVRLLGLAALDGEAYPFYDRQMAERLAASGMEIAALTPQKLAEWLVKVVS